MSTWIRTDYTFDEPCALLVIPLRRTLEIIAELRDGSRRDNPESLCKWITELIEFMRPDLKCVVLCAISFDMRRQCYLAAAIHQNLPKRKMGDEPGEIRL